MYLTAAGTTEGNITNGSFTSGERCNAETYQ